MIDLLGNGRSLRQEDKELKKEKKETMKKIQ
jgi:hypothetical protein